MFFNFQWLCHFLDFVDSLLVRRCCPISWCILFLSFTFTFGFYLFAFMSHDILMFLKQRFSGASFCKGCHASAERGLTHGLRFLNGAIIYGSKALNHNDSRMTLYLLGLVFCLELKPSLLIILLFNFQTYVMVFILRMALSLIWCWFQICVCTLRVYLFRNCWLVRRFRGF